MKVDRFRIAVKFLLVLMTVVLAKTTHAQTAPGSSQFSVAVLRPDFKSGDYTPLTSATFIQIKESVEGPVAFHLTVPLTYVRTDTKTGEEWEFRPANPSIGLSWTSSQRPAELGFSLQVPILPNDARGRVMRAADISRLEAFVPDLWEFSVHSVVGSDLDYVQAESGLSLWLPLHDAVELVANYSLTARAPLGIVVAGAQVRGRAALSDERLLFGERTIHEAGALLEFYIGKVRPGIVVRAPIQGRKVVNWVSGITLTFL